ncbi:peptide-binding protein [Campylobacterota bacterium]|nr:peptide-binding protein [Campylobacterota bacterium]
MRAVLIALCIFASTLAASEALKLTLGGFPARLNPILATDSVSSELSSWLFDALLKYDKNGEIAPQIASSWQFEDDRTIVFNLRRDYRWHDGEPVTAHDVLFTYQIAIGDRVFTPYASNFRMVESVETVGDYAVRVRYKTPYFKALETWLMPLIPKHILENDDDLMTSSFNTAPVGSSFYTLERLELSRNVELNAFALYKPQPPHIDRVTLEYVQDPSVEFLKLGARQIHIGSLDAMQVSRQIDERFREDYRIVETSSFGYTYLGFNLTNPKFANPKVREALSYAIDRDELVAILFFGHARVCDGPILPGALGYNNAVKSPKQDTARARALLAEAGYDENNPLEFELTTNSGNPIRAYAAEIILHQLAKSGVRVKLRVMEWQAFLSRIVHGRNYETLLMGWSVPLTPDLFTIWHSSSDKRGGFNFVGYKNERVDRLIEQAEKTSDRSLVAKHYEEISAQIASDNPYLFLYVPNAISAISRKLEPIEPTITGWGHNRESWRLVP